MATHPLEDYLQALRDAHATGEDSGELSHYPALCNLLNAVGKTLAPKVRCLINPTDRGAGKPDGGFYTEDQWRRDADAPSAGQNPARGVLEVKTPDDSAADVAASAQVARYCQAYGLVLVTTYREFLLVEWKDGRAAPLDGFTLAPSAAAFWKLAAHPRAAAKDHGDALANYLRLALLHAAPLKTPQDLAQQLATYARIAKDRLERRHTAALGDIRAAIEQALGLTFTGERGDHFFRSTLVQTLFYGVFSAWVLWARERQGKAAQQFDWRTAGWTLRVPMIRALFRQIADPELIEPLGLAEPLDLAGQALNRVSAADFFAAFDQGEAVQYFYEPFLEEFDPELRKELGVWYTPPEIVRYMVARVDTVLREELHLADGLADPRVVVLDPCCGTGAYLVEVLRHIATTLRAKGEDALVGNDLKAAAQTRVLGFEIMPAPFVIAHLQVGLLLQQMGAPLAGAKERAGIYLTNALTGWQPMEPPKDQLPLGLEEERQAATEIKRSRRILVVLGNPPYNGFAGMAVGEERGLVEAYRKTKRAPAPQGQGLNELYVRFFRMAERQIVEATGQGVVCFISNYSWLEGLSCTGMRERYLEVFDRVWIDCLNGDKYRTGKLTPNGESDPSVFSTAQNREGIQVGTAIGLLVRRPAVGPRPATPAAVVFRHLWGKGKLAQLAHDACPAAPAGYTALAPPVALGLPFAPSVTSPAYTTWPKLPDLLPASYPGVKTSRDDFLVDIDRDRLEERLGRYFDPALDHAEMRRLYPGLMTSTARYQAEPIREHLRRRRMLPDHVVRFTYRPFDVRWLYWEPETKLLDEKRTEYWPQVFAGNVWLEARQKMAVDGFDRGYFTRHMADNFGNGLSSFFPLVLRTEMAGAGAAPPVHNLSPLAEKHLAAAGLADAPDTLFYHALAVMHAPAYREENAGALRQDWPRVPLRALSAAPPAPATARALLVASAALGRQVAALLDVDQDVPGVTSGALRPELVKLGALARVGGGALDPDPAVGHFALTAGWGHGGKDGVTMPGRGKLAERPCTAAELAALAGATDPATAAAALGTATVDVYLNDVAYWSNVPAPVWAYMLGGYPVLKKWLSYRERPLLGRDLTPAEARYFASVARRIAALLLLAPALDANYRALAAASAPPPVHAGPVRPS